MARRVFVAYVVIAALLAVALIGSASLKLRRDPRAVEGIHHTVGVPLRWFPYLAALEIAGALGLLVGIAWAPIGIAAAVGVTIYMICAVVGHLRVHDIKGIANPMVPMALAIAALVTRVLSL